MGQQDIAVIQRLIEAFERRDIEGVLDTLDPEVEFRSVTGEILGHNPYRGHDGMRAYFRDERELWDELRITISEFIELDDQLVAIGRVWARSGARLIDNSAGWIWRLREGKVVYGAVFGSDTAARDAAGLD